MSAQAEVGRHAIRGARWHWSEAAFWLVVLACAFAFPSRYLIMADIVRLALFALSLDLILGYAGIVSLGHAAFFGGGDGCRGRSRQGQGAQERAAEEPREPTTGTPAGRPDSTRG